MFSDGHSLLKKRFGTGLQQLPRSLLRFIAHTNFRYGVRSIAHLIDIIDSKALRNGQLNIGGRDLPIKSEKDLQDSSLRLHLLDKDQGFGIVNRWKEYSRDNKMVSVTLDSPVLRLPSRYLRI